MQPEEQISLNKYISSTGFCSRREADELIEMGRVTANGKLMRTGARVKLTDKIEIDGEPLKGTKKKRQIYIAFNKPEGVTSTTDPKDKSNIIYYMNYPKRIFPIGRLDKDSEGLIFLTDDGDIVNKILRAGNNHEKEYIVYLDKAITPEFIKSMGNGVPINGTMTKKCYVKQEGNKKFRIILTQGLNRQIRKMCEYLGYKVLTLTRIRIMNVKLDNLATGKWRYFTEAEISTLNGMLSCSVKTEEASYIEPVKRKEPKPKPGHPGYGSAPGSRPNIAKSKPAAAKNKQAAAKSKPALPDSKQAGSKNKQEPAKGSYKSFRSKKR